MLWQGFCGIVSGIVVEAEKESLTEEEKAARREQTRKWQEELREAKKLKGPRATAVRSAWLPEVVSSEDDSWENTTRLGTYFSVGEKSKRAPVRGSRKSWRHSPQL